MFGYHQIISGLNCYNISFFPFFNKLTQKFLCVLHNLSFSFVGFLLNEFFSLDMHMNHHHHHHHSFNVSVPLKVGCTAPMFVLSFFLHSILLVGSALDSFQCLRSLLIVSFHVFFGLPRPRCPPTSNSVMLLIQPSFLTTCPNQRSRLYLNKVCMLLIPSFSVESLN